MLQAAEILFCQKSTNELLHPAHPEPGSSQAADGTFPANSTAPWKNACTPCQGPDPIRAATAAAAVHRVREEYSKQKLTVSSQFGSQGSLVSSASSGGEQAEPSQQDAVPTQPLGLGTQGSSKHHNPRQDADDQAGLHINCTKSIGNRFWLICCSLLMLGL